MKRFIFVMVLLACLSISNESIAGNKKNVYIVGGGGDTAIKIKKKYGHVTILPKDGGKFGTNKFAPPDDRFKAPDESKYNLPDKFKAPEGYKLPEYFIQRD